jgi:hypothetical protein
MYGHACHAMHNKNGNAKSREISDKTNKPKTQNTKHKTQKHKPGRKRAASDAGG